MSQIAFLVDDLGPSRAQSLKAIRDVFGLGYDDIARAASTSMPVAVRRLFDRSTPQFPASLLNLLLRLEHLAATVRVYQLLDGQSYDSRSTYYEITADRLRRLVLERARSLAEQQFLSSLGGVD